jgi:hypothetical protein
MASSIRPTRDSSLRLRTAPEEIAIDDWPLRDRPLPSSLAVTLAAGASWLAMWATHQPAIAITIAALLVLTLWRTLLPVRYELGPAGVVQSVLGWRRRIPWMAIDHFEPHADSVLLSPDAAVSALSPLRGLVVPCGAKRDAVIALLEYYLLGKSRTIPGSTQSAPAAPTALTHQSAAGSEQQP